MALGERLRITASDINGIQTVIKVYLEGYTGDVVERDPQTDYLNLNWGDSSASELPWMYGVTATINFWCEDNFEFNDLYSANSRNVYIEVTKSSVSLFKGFLEAENWTEPYVSPPFKVSLTAFDGLGFLEDEDFTDDDDEDYTGEWTPIEILSIILLKTGLSLSFNTAVTLRETSMISTGDPLSLYKKDVSTYEGLTCREVLEQLFRYCRIFQRNGEWWIISHDNWSNSAISYYNYSSAGVLSSSSSFAPSTSQAWWFEGEGQLELMPALKDLIVNQDYGLNSNLVINSTFKAWQT